MASFFDPVMQTNTSLLVHFLFIFYVKAYDHDSDFLHKIKLASLWFVNLLILVKYSVFYVLRLALLCLNESLYTGILCIKKQKQIRFK